VTPTAAAPARSPPRWLWLLGLFPLLVAAVGAVAALRSASAGAPVGATIDAGVLRIQRSGGAPLELRLSTVRAVEVPTDWGRVERLSGYATSEVWYGRWRSSTVGDFQLYAWQRTTWVLLDTDAGRVVLTPDDAPAFVAAARAGLRSR
jgi:hypothetical protein